MFSINETALFTRKKFILFGKIIGRVGYTAKYADIVHEMPETNNFTKPDTGPQFLLKAVTRNAQVILKIILSRAKF